LIQDLSALCDAALRETVAVGLAEGVRLPPDSVDQALAMMRSVPPHHTTSMGNGLLCGNRLDLPWFAGKMVELGRRHGIPTPVDGFIYAATEAVRRRSCELGLKLAIIVVHRTNDCQLLRISEQMLCLKKTCKAQPPYGTMAPRHRTLGWTKAANLRRLRHAKGISQEELAYAAGINRSYMSKLERAATYPGLEIIAKLASVLEVEPAELLRVPTAPEERDRGSGRPRSISR
jgi:DNA-binding XRE family transcriptional regulator